jgi:hypothetical protein
MKKTNKIKTNKVKKGFGITSLILGIVSLLCFLVPYFGVPIGILAVVFANMQNKIKATSNASAGKIMGILGIIGNGIILLIMILFLSFFSQFA